MDSRAIFRPVNNDGLMGTIELVLLA